MAKLPSPQPAVGICDVIISNQTPSIKLSQVGDALPVDPKFLLDGSSESIQIQHAHNESEYIVPGTLYTVDGFHAPSRTIYEFYGCFIKVVLAATKTVTPPKKTSSTVLWMMLTIHYTALTHKINRHIIIQLLTLYTVLYN